METTDIENNISSKDDEISIKDSLIKLRESLSYLLRKWVLIAIAIFIGGLSGYFYSKFKDVVYHAECTFVLEEGGPSGGLGQFAGIASMVGVDVGSGGGIFQGDNIIELYKSRTMIEKALLSQTEVHGKMQLLIDRYIEFNKLREHWSKNPQLSDITFTSSDSTSSFTRAQDSILGAIVNDIRANYLKVDKLDKKSSIIKVEVNSKDEILAKVFNDQIVKNVNDFYIKTKTKKSLENITILQQKTDSVRAVMNGAIYRGVAVADATPNLNPTRQVQRAVPIQKAQISVETNKAILAELVKNLEMSKMSLRQETPLIQVIDPPVYPLEIERFSERKGILIGSFISTCILILFLLVNKPAKNRT